jgi:hypothetical protein
MGVGEAVLLLGDGHHCSDHQLGVKSLRVRERGGGVAWRGVRTNGTQGGVGADHVDVRYSTDEKKKKNVSNVGIYPHNVVMIVPFL